MKFILPLLFLLSLPLSSQERDPEIAKQFLEATEFEKSIIDTGDATFSTVKESLAEQNLTDKEMQDVKDAFMAYMGNLASDPEIKTKSIEAYQKHFTDDELKELIEFYKSPLWRKISQTQPAIMGDIMQFSMKVAQKHVGPFQETLQKILERKAEKELEKAEGE